MKDSKENIFGLDESEYQRLKVNLDTSGVRKFLDSIKEDYWIKGELIEAGGVKSLTHDPWLAFSLVHEFSDVYRLFIPFWGMSPGLREQGKGFVLPRFTGLVIGTVGDNLYTHFFTRERHHPFDSSSQPILEQNDIDLKDSDFEPGNSSKIFARGLVIALESMIRTNCQNQKQNQELPLEVEQAANLRVKEFLRGTIRILPNSSFF